MQQPLAGPEVERHQAVRRLEQPIEAVFDADDLPSVLTHRVLGERPDHRVQAGRVAPTGEDCDPPCHPTSIDAVYHDPSPGC
jgi:hypothetical protein